MDPAGPADSPAVIAVKAWMDMGRRMDWAALPFLIELYGVEDVEGFKVDLLAIRDYEDNMARAQR